MKKEDSLVNRDGRAVKAAQTMEEITFGEFVVSFYDSCGNHGAGAMVSRALNAGLIVLQSPGLGSRLPDHEHQDDDGFSRWN
jgi:hypothetical protein